MSRAVAQAMLYVIIAIAALIIAKSGVLPTGIDTYDVESRLDGVHVGE